MASIKVQQSRFALLTVEDDDSDDGSRKQQQKPGAGNQKNAQKKKNKKKKQQQAENDELKHLAFGMPGKGHQGGGAAVQNGKAGEVSDAQWDEWQKKDKGYAADAFEKDLQQALLLSKLESEQNKKKPGDSQKGGSAEGQRGGGDGDSSKKKKKKDKPAAMSLEEFNKHADKHKTQADELDAVRSPSSPVVKPGPQDKEFFNKVDSDVNRILRQEKMQEEYKKQYAAESVITAKYQDQISRLQKEIDFLRATMKKQEEELKQVKKRNKQLCVILAQGEMKEKAEVLIQVDQLNEVKDELTEQVSSLTVELEKEKSKVHTLKAELDKQKGVRHK